MNTDKNKARAYITKFSDNTGNATVKRWQELGQYLLVKYMDGNIKEAAPVPAGYKYAAPIVKQPGYGDSFYRELIKETGDKFKVVGPAGH